MPLRFAPLRSVPQIGIAEWMDNIPLELVAPAEEVGVVEHRRPWKFFSKQRLQLSVDVFSLGLIDFGRALLHQFVSVRILELNIVRARISFSRDELAVKP